MRNNELYTVLNGNHHLKAILQTSNTSGSKVSLAGRGATRDKTRCPAHPAAPPRPRALAPGRFTV